MCSLCNRNHEKQVSYIQVQGSLLHKFIILVRILRLRRLFRSERVEYTCDSKTKHERFKYSPHYIEQKCIRVPRQHVPRVPRGQAQFSLRVCIIPGSLYFGQNSLFQETSQLVSRSTHILFVCVDESHHSFTMRYEMFNDNRRYFYSAATPNVRTCIGDSTSVIGKDDRTLRF